VITHLIIVGTVTPVRLGLALAMFVVLGLGGGASGVLLAAQIAYYGIGKAVIGLLFLAFAAGSLLAGAVSGGLMRRFGLRGELALGTALYSAATLAGGLLPPFPALVAITVVWGFGGGIIESALNTYLAALPRRVVLLNLLHACYGVGALIGPVVAATMFANGLSWGALYLVFAAASAPLLAGFTIWYPARPPAEPGETPGPVFAAALRHPSVLLCSLFLAIYVGLEITIGNWMYSFLVEERGNGALLAGWVVSAFWMGFTFGRFVISALAERFGVGPITLAWACLVAFLFAGAIVWLIPGVPPAAAGLVLVGFVLGPLYPLAVAVVPQLVPDRLVPTAIGMLIGASVVGGALFPWAAGALAEGIGLGSLLPFILLLGVALLINWWRVSRRFISPA
jgi:fucose permease